MNDQNQNKEIYEIVKKGDLEKFLIIIECEIDLESKNKYGDTLLKIAVDYHHLEIVRLLLQAGALPVFPDGSLLSRALNYALIDKDITILEELVEAGIDINQSLENDDETAIMRAAQYGNFEVVKMLFYAGANVNALTNGGYFALWNAANQGWQEIHDYLAPLTSLELRKEAEELLPKGLIFRQRLNDQFTEDFIGAAAIRDVNAVVDAIKNGVNINAFGSDENTALYIAANLGHLVIVSILVEAGADLEIGRESDSTTPLMAAAGTLGLAKSKFGSPEMEKNLLEIIALLLKAGANVNAKTTEGWNALEAAANSGSIEAVQLLLSAGADVNSRDNWGDTAKLSPHLTHSTTKIP